MPGTDRSIVGWDVGGAHLKACWMLRGRVVDVAQWACPLWQGLQHLEQALGQAAARWPALGPSLREARHAVTMTGEMADLFADREDGVHRIAALLTQSLASAPCFYAGDAGWCGSEHVAARWEQIASANWLATARHVALCVAPRHAVGVLIDIGSTTTDLIVFEAGAVCSPSRTDTQRLASGELVYQGVVRTPLCALAPRIAFRGTGLNVMNEFFATTADVYRLTQELNPEHDLHTSADGAAKDLLGTQRRLARMVGFDARDASDTEWLAFAQAWRGHQVREIGSQLKRVLESHAVPDTAVIVSAGCGDFLVPDIVAESDDTRASRRPVFRYGNDIAPVAVDADAGLAAWAQVCAPSVAVAALFDRELG